MCCSSWKLALIFQVSKNYGWASSGCSILSEIGTMHLEFTYLSDITNNPVFKSKVENVRKVLKSLDKPKGLYPNYIHPRTGKWGQRKCLNNLRCIYMYLLYFFINIRKYMYICVCMFQRAKIICLENYLQIIFNVKECILKM